VSWEKAMATKAATVKENFMDDLEVSLRVSLDIKKK
jgi:hypothetical protein